MENLAEAVVTLLWFTVNFVAFGIGLCFGIGLSKIIKEKFRE